MKNTLDFDAFIASLQPTNRTLGFYVDWEKCVANVDKIKISLNHLNFLLGIQEQQLQEKISILFNEYPKAFEVLPLLLTIRDSKKEQLLDESNKVCDMNSYLTEPQKIYEFICKSGLDKIFSDRKIKDLNDFVFGMEKEYIVSALDGFTFDNQNNQKENLQILDFISAKNLNEAKRIATSKNYGNYQEMTFYQFIR